jgi:steroid delta-isomerase-like uncharacterized protein
MTIMSEQNKALVRRIPEELFNKGDLSVADQVFAQDYVEHVERPPGYPSGVPGIKQFVADFRAAFPDLQYTVEDVLGEGEKVVLRTTVRGTHRGPFLGIPATGKQATWSEIHIGRLANGKLAEHWAVRDQLSMLQQLGVIPAGKPGA